MAALLTILSAASNKHRLAKTFTQNETHPYPQVKRLNSFSYEQEVSSEGLRQRFELLKENARYGNAMLKGPLLRELKNESRTGLTNRDALATTLVLDIDKWPYKFNDEGVCTSEDVKNVAEEIIKTLPPCLHGVSYIAHASASFGMRVGNASVHIEFLLERPVAPRTIKVWLQVLNLVNPAINDALTLSNSGQAISWIIDPSVADNSRIIYIAPPVFIGRKDPFNGEIDQRWVLVEKEKVSADIANDVQITHASVATAQAGKKLNDLRRIAGLPTRTLKTKPIQQGDRKVEVISNPLNMTIVLERIDDQYAIFNVNGGDSCAYWSYIKDPDIIYNFKGEQPFQFSKADPEGYANFMETYKDKVVAARPIETVVFHDNRTDRFWLGRYDQQNDRFIPDNQGAIRHLNVIQKANIEAALADYGTVMPDPIPQVTMFFDPHNDCVYDKARRCVNQFELPPLLRGQAKIPEDYKGLTYDHENLGGNNLAAYINALCPTIHKIIWHAIGNDMVCYEHFINWIAFAAQKRRVSTTTWVFSGVQGTGKGILFERILSPIWTTEYASFKKLANFEDAFNGGLERQLLVGIDEVHMSSANNPGKLLNDLKHLIASESGTIRAMQTDQRQVNYYFNFILFSNHIDAVRIEPGDRRFNIAPPQMTKLNIAYPDIEDLIASGLLESEVPLFASLIVNMQVNETAARKCLENDAKERMKVNSMTSQEVLFDAVKIGNLDYFIERIFMYKPDESNFAEIHRTAAAKSVIADWITAAKNNETYFVSSDELRLVYLALNPESNISITKFGSMVAKNGIQLERKFVRNKRLRCYEVAWTCDEEVVEDETVKQENTQDTRIAKFH